MSPLAEGPEFDVIRAILAGDTQGEGGSGEGGFGETTLPAGLRLAPMVGPGDDAAVLHDGTVVSTDVAIEGVHFRVDWVDQRAAGDRATRAALSDLAAMGASPTAVFVNLSGPDPDALIEAGRGVRHAARTFGARLLGGDVAGVEGPLTIGVTVIGHLTGRAPWCRSGARPGDALWVTGELGAAAAAVEAWNAGETPTGEALERFLRPVPRFAPLDALHAHLAPRASIDVSDGVAADARHLAKASGVRVVVEADLVPIAESARAGRTAEQALTLALEGGEDYELLMSAPDSDGLGATVTAAAGLPLTRIGRVEPGDGAVLEAGDGSVRRLEGGFGHWAGSVARAERGRDEG